jgi:hypothetical protein
MEPVSPEQPKAKEITKTDIVSYLDNKISNQQSQIRNQESLNARGSARRLDFDPADAKLEVQRLQELKQAAAGGEYKGLVSELDNDIGNKEAELRVLGNEMKQGFPDDARFWDLMREEKEGIELSEKLPETAKSWASRRIEDLKAQRQETERGKKLPDLSRVNKEVLHLKQLKQAAINPPSTQTNIP